MRWGSREFLMISRPSASRFTAVPRSRAPLRYGSTAIIARESGGCCGSNV